MISTILTTRGWGGDTQKIVFEYLIVPGFFFEVTYVINKF